MDRCFMRAVVRTETPRPGRAKRRDRRFESGGSAAQSAANHTDLRLTLADLFYGSNLPERPSPAFIRLVCIQEVRRETIL